MTSAIWVWNDMYKNIIEQVRAGTWKNGSYWYGMADGVVDIAPYGPMVPQNVRDLTDKAKADHQVRQARRLLRSRKGSEGRRARARRFGSHRQGTAEHGLVRRRRRRHH